MRHVALVEPKPAWQNSAREANVTPIANDPSKQLRACPTSLGCQTLASFTARVSELERRVSTDDLTGVWNRAHFDRIVDREMDRSVREKRLVTLVLIDIDRFKSINDTHGHQTGDAVLREIAGILQKAARSSDTLFRWGGEEFALLAGACGYRGAARMSEHLRETIASHHFPGVGRITVSIGVAEHHGTESAQEWFRRADAMLYAAKHSGRNAVCVDGRGNSDVWSAEHGLSALHLVWAEAYGCGDPSIDRQHMELFDLSNVLIDNMLSNGNEVARILPACDRLMAHIAAHFADEEALLEKHNYRKLAAHRRAHAGLLAHADQLRREIPSGRTSMGTMAEFLAGDVVARHLFKMDREFFPIFASHNAPPTEPACEAGEA